MTTPPPVYESPRWLPPPIASTEGGRRLVSQTLGRRSGMPVLYSGRERGGLRLRYRAEPRLWRFRARFRVWKLPTRSWVHAREHGDGRRSTPHSRHRADTVPTRGDETSIDKKQKWLRDQKSTPNANEKIYAILTSP